MSFGLQSGRNEVGLLEKQIRELEAIRKRLTICAYVLAGIALILTEMAFF